jgi:uncharacterized protein
MQPDVLTSVGASLRDCALLGAELDVLWHAGEPLVVPATAYRRLTAALDEAIGPATKAHYRLQTNGMLIDDDWCDYFLESGTRIGLSLDGSQAVHDRYRVTRGGRGTYEETRRGLEFLQRRKVPYYVLATVTDAFLVEWRTCLDHFVELGVCEIGFNVETQLGEHRDCTVDEPKIHAGVEFLYAALRLSLAGTLRVREFAKSAGKLVAPSDKASGLSTAGAVITVDWLGNVSFFSPELAGHHDLRFGSFAMGNVLECSISSMMGSDRFRKLSEEISAGVEMCRTDCEYFPYCGGGSPANKLFENGTFRSTVTNYCRFHVQAPIDLVLHASGNRT